MSDEQIDTVQAGRLAIDALVNVGFAPTDIQVTHDVAHGCMWVRVRVQRVDELDAYIPCQLFYSAALSSEVGIAAKAIKEHIEALRRF